LADGLDTGGDALGEFRQQLFGNADALQAHSEKIVQLVQSLGGLAKATPAQLQAIQAEVQKLVDGFELAGERPPVALAALAKAMGVTASTVKADAEKATAAVKGLVEAVEEAARVPTTRFGADLELDEGSIRERLAAVQSRLREIKDSTLIQDPGEEFGLIEEESRLLGDLQRAERAWQEVAVDANRTREEGNALSDEHIRLLRDQGLLTEDLAAGLGLTADQLQRANVGFQVAGDQLGGLVESGSEAAGVTLPELDRAALDASRSSGVLGDSLQAISEELLVTAGNADQAGAGLAAAGEEGAAGQAKADKAS
jgi:hypothetical protein